MSKMHKRADALIRLPRPLQIRQAPQEIAVFHLFGTTQCRTTKCRGKSVQKLPKGCGKFLIVILLHENWRKLSLLLPSLQIAQLAL
jgi:hypothetical protein